LQPELLGCGRDCVRAGKAERVVNIFIAGGSGTIGIPLVRALIAAGHPVTAMTRSTNRHDELKRMGASVVGAGALNRDAVIAAVRAAHPTHVIHQLTALPQSGPRRPADVEATNRLRIDGTRYLLEAAIHAGVRRLPAHALLAPRRR
jgi:nucleoside-diphosphate-sugar epimerase